MYSIISRWAWHVLATDSRIYLSAHRRLMVSITIYTRHSSRKQTSLSRNKITIIITFFYLVIRPVCRQSTASLSIKSMKTMWNTERRCVGWNDLKCPERAGSRRSLCIKVISFGVGTSACTRNIEKTKENSTLTARPRKNSKFHGLVRP